MESHICHLYSCKPSHVGKGTDMCQRCSSNLPFPTEAYRVWACAKSVSVTCQKMYPYPLKLFQKFMGMSMCRKCFGNLLFHTEACWEVYPHPQKLFQQFILTYQGMHRKYFSNLPFPTEAC